MTDRIAPKMDATALVESLRDIYRTNRGDVRATYRWEDEQDRWHELVFATLHEVGGVGIARARRIMDALASLHLLSLEMLADQVDERGEIDFDTPHMSALSLTMSAQGAPRDTTLATLSAVCRAARSIRRISGKPQVLLRSQLEHVLDELADKVDFGSLDKTSGRSILTLWLQNVLDAPLALADRYTREYCSQHGVTWQAVVAAADQLDLNVAAVDDLLRVHMLRSRNK